MTDPNGNRVEVAFDTLGMVVGTAVMGKASESKGDLLDNTFNPDLDDATILAHIANPLANPQDILQKATTRLIYDLFRLPAEQGDIAAATGRCLYTRPRNPSLRSGPKRTDEDPAQLLLLGWFRPGDSEEDSSRAGTA